MSTKTFLYLAHFIESYRINVSIIFAKALEITQEYTYSGHMCTKNSTLYKSHVSVKIFFGNLGRRGFSASGNPLKRKGGGGWVG